MSAFNTLARPYARAAFAFAKAANSIDMWENNLSKAAQLWEHDSCRKTLTEPCLDRNTKVNLLHTLINEDSPNLRNFLHILVVRTRLDLLPTIYRMFVELRCTDQGYIQVKVETAYPLSNEDECSLKCSLEKYFAAKKALLNIEQNPQLLGGIRCRVQDWVIDYSIQGQIQRLQNCLFLKNFGNL